MTIEELRECKRVLGYSNKMLAEKSGVPLGTVQKVLCGVTRHPRKRTLDALSKSLASGMKEPQQGVYVHWKNVQKELYTMDRRGGRNVQQG